MKLFVGVVGFRPPLIAVGSINGKYSRLKKYIQNIYWIERGEGKTSRKQFGENRLDEVFSVLRRCETYEGMNFFKQETLTILIDCSTKINMVI